MSCRKEDNNLSGSHLTHIYVRLAEYAERTTASTISSWLTTLDPSVAGPVAVVRAYDLAVVVRFPAIAFCKCGGSLFFIFLNFQGEEETEKILK